MKQLPLVILLVLSSAPVSAEWVLISVLDQAGVTIDVESDTIHHNENRVTMSELIDYRTTQTVAGTSYLSASLQREYDCVGNVHRTLTLTELSGNMGTGTVRFVNSDTHKWQPVDPGSIAKRLWKFACGKK